MDNSLPLLTDQHTSIRKMSYGHRIGHYKIIKHIGRGGFSDIYLAQERETLDYFALKTEFLNARKQALLTESQFFKNISDSIYLPKMYEIRETKKIRFLVMDVFGPSVSTLRKSIPNQAFSIPTFIFLAKQMMFCIREFHSFNFCHHDVKPSNYLLKPGSKQNLVLVDFGLSTDLSLKINQKTGFKGTIKYASPFAHQGMSMSKRDDIYSWYFSILEMIIGDLPWKNFKDHESVCRLKQDLNNFMRKTKVPLRLQQLFLEIQSLDFNDEPDYDLYINEIDLLAQDFKEDVNVEYDWEKLDIEQIKKVSVFPLTQNEDESIHVFPLDELIDMEEIRRKRECHPSDNLQNLKSDIYSTGCNLL